MSRALQNPDPMSVEEFRRIRLALGLSQTALGHVIGYSDDTMISQLENGHKPISRKLKLLMEAFAQGFRPANWPVPKTVDAPAFEPPVRSQAQYDADKAAGINRIGKPFDGKALPPLGPDDKPLFPEQAPRSDDDVLPPLKPRTW
jgi:transcriptional regulator with XRE-family HTH domain